MMKDPGKIGIFRENNYKRVIQSAIYLATTAAIFMIFLIAYPWE